MEATTLTSVKLELLLGYARAELLRLAGEQDEDDDEIDDDIVAFACALARNCFINVNFQWCSIVHERAAQAQPRRKSVRCGSAATVAALWPMEL